MKFMKLGSKPDIFKTCHNVTTVAASELVSDICVEVDGHKFLLHKFPLLSKSEYLNKTLKKRETSLQNKAGVLNNDSEDEEDSLVILRLCEFPGSVESFEMCAKFCYGITFTLNASNVSAVRCAAEYLEMTETIEKSNLIFKLEVFFNSSILRGWKDSILCLQQSKSFIPWAEHLKLLSRCVDSISCKTAVDPSMVDWSFTYTRPKFPCFQPHPRHNIECSSSPPPPPPPPPLNGTAHSCSRHHDHQQHQPVPKDWWVEDICNLEIALYSRVMVAVKAKGAPWDQVGEALRVYAMRWLPGVSKEHSAIQAGDPSAPTSRMMRNHGPGLKSAESFVETSSSKQWALILESLVSLLPSEKGSCSCSFLLRLLKSATILNASQSSKLELAHRIGLQLEEASLQDLIILSIQSYTDINSLLYDVDLVQLVLEHYLSQELCQSAPAIYPMQSHDDHNTPSKLLHVAKLIDGYLVEIAKDPNLPLLKFVQIAEPIPDFARPVHDGLYLAIDTYLKEHPGMPKSDRKRICKLMDCKKLSMDACIHACQNDRLPLRVVVQVSAFPLNVQHPPLPPFCGGTVMN
ncbi:hypothetical protein BDL97_19G066400 [Sphagnum fallax]|nr:hypothetical protein BDL97_19G066400 [Sphagnum fallax]